MADHSERIRLASPKDAALLLYLPVLATIATLVPRAAWAPLCRAWSASLCVVRPTHTSRLRQQIAAVCGTHLPASSLDATVAELTISHHLAWLHLLRAQTWRSRPPVTLRGREQLDAALARGRGAILWVAPLMFSDLMTKAALHEAGYRVSHLSRSEHGFSPTRFGRRVLNPIWTSAERRFLAERLVFTPGRDQVLRAMVKRLRQNQVVSIVFGPQGSRVQHVPFLETSIAVAGGAIKLARMTGARLLPVFTVRDGTGSIVTTLEAPIDAEDALATPAGRNAVARRYAQRLQQYVLEWPGQYQHWAGNAEGVPIRQDRET